MTSLEARAREVVNASTLAELTATVGPDHAARLIGLLKAELSSAPDTMRDLHSAEDWRGFERLCHTLKSTAQSFGAIPLAQSALSLEDAAKRNPAAISAGEIDLFDALTAETLEALDALGYGGAAPAAAPVKDGTPR